ncbi:AGE family epimerase/isomerase [Microlunatus sp. Y2014]|uniref:AGE family epimerase/isomerase n=1 Tax=Microlunatus sp. Y2014 TaxID=3418488 RepID=UPI003DA77EBD
MASYMLPPDGLAELRTEAERLLVFGHAARVPRGFAWLDTSGRPTHAPLRLYVTARLTHVYSLAALLGHEGAADLVGHGLSCLETSFHDDRYGGWFTSVDPDHDQPVDDTKQAYPHVFVMLAASSAVIAGLGGERLLEQACAVYDEHFWDDEYAMGREEWDRAFTSTSAERGANSTMHAVEAFLTVAVATGDDRWQQRAEAMAERITGVAESHDWRIPEHFDQAWIPDLERHRDSPRDPVKPYGATPGHGLEWARLLLQLQAGGTGDRDWLPVALHLADRAIADAWAVDGADGFVYTVDWQGRPLVRNRLHWVACEALGAAAALWQRTGDDTWARWWDTWWRYVERHLIDREHGSWHHELDERNRPAATIRPGKADLYHAVQSCLLPALPLRPAIAQAVRDLTRP